MNRNLEKSTEDEVDLVLAGKDPHDDELLTTRTVLKSREVQMAVTPQEVLSKMSEKDAKALNALEDDIDRKLREDFDGVSLTYVYDSMSARVRDALRKKYENAGWSVSFQTNQHDGSTIRFSVRETSPLFGYGGPWDR